MFKPWTGWRARTWLAVAGVNLGALVAAAPAVSASTLGGQAGASARGAGVGPATTCRQLAWRARRVPVPAALPAATVALRPSQHVGGLSLPEHLHAKPPEAWFT